MNSYDPNEELTRKQRWILALRNFGRVVLRLLLIVLVIGALTAMVFWGAPALSRRYLLPVQENSERLAQLQTSQAQASGQFSRQIDSVESRYDTLVAQSALDARQNAQTISALQAQLDRVQKTLKAQLDGSQSDLAGALERLDSLDTSLQELNNSVVKLAASQEAVQTDLQSYATVEAGRSVSVEALHREIQMMKAMQLLLRARLFLGQSNFGLARQDVQTGRDLLADLALNSPPSQASALEAILARLDLSLGNLPDYPVFAADDLEIAWAMLVAGLPGGGRPTPTPLPAESAGPTPTPFSSPTLVESSTATANPPLTPSPTSKEPASTTVP